MEYLPDGTLAGWLTARRAAGVSVPVAEARDMMLQVAQGARAVHREVVHRDLRPPNILRDGSRLKLADFGIAKRAGAATQRPTFRGLQAPEYMAPESFRNEPNTYKMDVYAAGLVFYEICTLDHPLAASVGPTDPGGWSRAHRLTVPAPLSTRRPDLPAGIAGLVDRMLAKAPDARPEWDDVIRILADEDVDPPEDVAAVLTAGRRQRHAVAVATSHAARLVEAAAEREAGLQAACEDLARQFDNIAREVERYDPELELVIVPGPQGARTYQFTHAAWVSCIFLNPEYRGTPVGDEYLLGAAYLTVTTDGGPSANVLLLGDRPDSASGRWAGAVFPDPGDGRTPPQYGDGGAATPQARRYPEPEGASAAGAWRGVRDGYQLSGVLPSALQEDTPARVEFVGDARALFLGLVRAALEMPPYGGLIALPDEVSVGTRKIVRPPRLG